MTMTSEKTAESTATKSSTTTKKELIERIAAETNQSRADVKKTVQAFLDQVIGELGRGNRLEFRDFGVFEIRERAARRRIPRRLSRSTFRLAVPSSSSRVG